MLEIFQYDFMLRAFAAGLVIAVVAPLIGSFLVMRRFSLIADTLSHVALSGVAFSALTGLPYLVTTFGVTTLAGLFIERLRTRGKMPGEAVLAMFLPGGLALSVVLISLTGGSNVNLISYLFGSITTLQDIDLGIIFGLGISVVFILAALRRQMLFASFDEDVAKVNGLPITLLNNLLVILTAITVTVAMRVVGVLLMGALLVIPVMTAVRISRSFTQSLYFAIGSALLAVVLGLFVAFYFNIPAGGSIVLVSLGLFGIVAMVFR